MDQPFDEIHIFKRFYAYYTPSARSWVENHSKCNENMRLWLGVGIVCFILKQIKYLVQILYGAIWMPQYLMQCVLRKTVCSTSSVSERGDMDSENHNVVIRSIGSHSVKSTVSRLITLMGIQQITRNDFNSYSSWFVNDTNGSDATSNNDNNN